MRATNRLEVRGICKAFGGVTAVHSVTFDLKRGELFGLLGPSGAGKTTLVDCLCGQVRKDAGVVRLAGQEITHFGASRLVELGLVRTFERPRGRFRLSPLDLMTVFLAAPRAACEAAGRRARAEELLAEVGLEAAGSRAVGALSVVELRCLELARCLALQPEVLVTDALLAGLGNREAARLTAALDRLREQGTTLVIVEPELIDWLRKADRLAVLRLGEKIADGTPAEIGASDRARAAGVV